MSRHYCSFCHVTVAPHDPQRLKWNDRYAHEGCLNNRNLGYAALAAEVFFSVLGQPIEKYPTVISDVLAGKIRNRKRLIEATAQCLAALDPTDATLTAKTDLFIDTMERLVYADLRPLVVTIRDAKAKLPIAG